MDEGTGDFASPRSVVMLCDLIDSSEQDILLDVAWYFDTHDLVSIKQKEEAINYRDLPAELPQEIWSDYDQGGMNHEVCIYNLQYTHL